jgi:Protein of Unknown function (DUF2784)
LYLLIANAILGLHLAFIAFVLVGGLFVLHYPRLAWLHIPAVMWGAIVEFMDWPCPLTAWENHFINLGGARPYQGDFVWHYLPQVIFPAGATPNLDALLGGIVVVLNFAVYLVDAIKPKRRRSGVRDQQDAPEGDRERLR